MSRLGVTPERLIEACGLDAGSARLVPGDRLDDELPFPIFDQNTGARCPYVRAGRTGEWAFAMDEWMLTLHLEAQGGNVWQRLSAGTEVVVVSWTEKPNETFEYWADGEWVTSFEPYMAWNRGGESWPSYATECVTKKGTTLTLLTRADA